MIDKISKSILFKGINKDEVKIILEKFHYNIKSFKKDEIIAFRGDPCDCLMIVLEGLVSAHMQDPNGKVIKIEDIPESMPLAPAFIFGKKHFFPIDIMSSGDSKIIVFPKQSFLDILQFSPVFLENYLNIVCNKAQFLSQKVWFNFNNKTLDQKIADYILNIAKDDEFILDKTHSELAQLLGTERPSVSRIFKKFYDKGILEKKDKKTLILKNRDLLEEIVNN